MDVASILKKIVALNNHIQNSLVKKGSQPTSLVAKLVDHINSGKMIYDSIRGYEKPDLNWNQATLMLQKCKDTLSPEIFNAIIADVQKFTKPHKLERFAVEWEKWLKRDSEISLDPEVVEESSIVNSSTNIQNLLNAAAHLEKSADNMNVAKARLAQLINSHVNHIAGLIDRGQSDEAKEYLDVIRPQGWEKNTERNIDKLYEQVVKGLAEKLNPEAFQALGL
ncbi:hypothetical protein M0R72_01615 [Candidatus Pacearchaeota archaeon]|jgi:hypothetical protein|nr:hypothetical protein [Candidatus Pacearchaeota archaeon]